MLIYSVKPVSVISPSCWNSNNWKLVFSYINPHRNQCPAVIVTPVLLLLLCHTDNHSQITKNKRSYPDQKSGIDQKYGMDQKLGLDQKLCLDQKVGADQKLVCDQKAGPNKKCSLVK